MSSIKNDKLRVLFQLVSIIQFGQRCTPDQLAERLKIHRRTLFRYIKDLKQSGIPINFDRNHKRYTIDTDFFLQSPGLTFNETMGLLALAYKLKSHSNTLFDRSALSAIEKIESLLPENRTRLCHRIIDKISNCSAHQIITKYAEAASSCSMESTDENRKTVSIKHMHHTTGKGGKLSKLASI